VGLAWDGVEGTPAADDAHHSDDTHQDDAHAAGPHDHAVWDGGFGVGSAAPNDDGCMPLGHPIKAVYAFGGVYQVPGSDWYDVTTPDVWFISEDAAQAAGFHRGEG
jgi:hypothetical protein